MSNLDTFERLSRIESLTPGLDPIPVSPTPALNRFAFVSSVIRQHVSFSA